MLRPILVLNKVIQFINCNFLILIKHKNITYFSYVLLFRQIIMFWFTAQCYGQFGELKDW